jgi:uncharacterized membrane protein YidH (DUF202 family)
MEYLIQVKNFIRSGYYTPLSADAPTQRRPNPKGYFANERTFLSWIQFGVVIAGLAVGLLNFSDSDVGLYSAMVFCAVAYFIMGYAYYRFRWRANKLKNQEGGFYGNLLLLAVITLF